MTRYLCHMCETFPTPCEFEDHDVPCSGRPLPKACAWSGNKAEWKIAPDPGVPITAPATPVDKRSPEEPGLWIKIPADKIDYISVSRNHAPELGIKGQYWPDIDTLLIDYETARQGIDILSKRKEAP